MRIAILGTGYVGLTTATTFAFLGNEVRCLDVDPAKIALLSAGKSPIYEPHLERMLDDARARIVFTTDPEVALPGADVVFICVGTPPSPDGSPDMRYVRAAAEAIGHHLAGQHAVVVNKSTVPIGSGNWVESVLRDMLVARGLEQVNGFSVASNPEFLREGTALFDSLFPDRIVIGADDDMAREKLRELYRPVLEQSFDAPAYLPRPVGLHAVPLVTTSLPSAELIKYAANAFLALKISFINEVAELTERVGADVRQVAQGIGLDARIGPRFLAAGLGWGGSCFGKDTAALVATGKEYGLDMRIVRAARDVNDHQRERLVDKLVAELKLLSGKTVGLLGLAFKPDTDDLRDAPVIELARRLVRRGARVRVHDPVAMPRARTELSGMGLEFCEHAEGVAQRADALVLVTEWAAYGRLPWGQMGEQMRSKVIVDGRNALDRSVLEAAGFRYIGMGM